MLAQRMEMSGCLFNFPPVYHNLATAASPSDTTYIYKQEGKKKNTKQVL